MTDTCENITLPQTLFAGGNESAREYTMKCFPSKEINDLVNMFFEQNRLNHSLEFPESFESDSSSWEPFRANLPSRLMESDTVSCIMGLIL